jgi:imidazolonepropionase-like amidohydrolase
MRMCPEQSRRRARIGSLLLVSCLAAMAAALAPARSLPQARSSPRAASPPAALLAALAPAAPVLPPARPASPSAVAAPGPAGASDPAAAIVIRAGRLLDGRGKALEDVTVVVAGSRIASVRAGEPERTGERGRGEGREPGAPGAAAPMTYDLRGLTVLPGGIDTHVHIGWHFGADGRSRDGAGPPESAAQSALYAAENAVATVRGGVTTVQSLGAAADRDLREALARGVIPGPRLLTSLTPIDEEAGPPEAIRAAVRKLAADGADVVKVFASKSIRDGGAPTLSQEQLDAACGEARAHGLRSAVHAHGIESVRRAVLAGCGSIEHGVLLDAASLRLIAERGAYFDPNLDLVFRNYFENQDRFIGIGNYTAAGFAQMRKAVPRALAVFRQALATPGLKVVFGTDALAGAHGRNFEELVYRVEQGGQDPMAAIVSATSLAAESLRLGDRIGTVAPGYDADLIAVEGDPRRDIRSLLRVVWVMKSGRVVKNEIRAR